MKKLLLGVFLILLLGLISYLQYVRSAERRAEAWIKGHDVGQRKAEQTQPTIDSLLDLLDQERARLASLKNDQERAAGEKEADYQATVDSLSGLIERQRSEIGRLQTQLTSAKSQQRASAKTGASSEKRASSGDILTHYRLAVAKLPADLSDYEQRVALAEIRTEVAQKFGITVDRLNQIREDSNLDY